MQKHLIVIGGVAAGAKTAAKAKREDPNLKITIYNAGNYISYSACGLPYFIENLFDKKERLIVKTPESFQEDGINVFLRHKVLKINPEIKKITVKNLETNEIFEDEYSTLMIATGARAFIPDIEGINSKNIFTVREIDDAVELKNKLKTTKKAAIVGGGYIGIEMAEALSAYDIDFTIIEASAHVLPPIDEDMAELVQNYMKEKNIKFILNDGVKKFISDENNAIKQIETNSGKIIDAEVIILAIGVKPNTELAKDAGIEIGQTGAIKVNNKMQTNISNIYAAGDCAESFNIVLNQSTWTPLGSVANRHGRVAALNIAGQETSFSGVCGSFVTKILDFTIAKTGMSEKEALKYGYDYESVTITERDRAGYIPHVKDITIKMLCDKSGKILGAQVLGEGDADKRINEIAACLYKSMTVSEFIDVDLTYAPPFSPAIDSIAIAAQILQKKLLKY